MMHLGNDPAYTMGVGYLGEVRQGPDGNLYAWSQGVDGIGNPVGFWRFLRRSRSQYLRPVVTWTGMAGYDGYAGLEADPDMSGLDDAMYVAGLQANDMVEGLSADDPVSGINAADDLQGFGAHDMTQVMGIGYLGEVRPGPDGNLYAWVQGIDGLGNPVGFWRRLKRLRRRLQPFLRSALPMASRIASMVPGYGTAIAAGLRTATPLLQRAGIADYDGYADLTGYEGFAAGEELLGFGADDDLRGFGADDDLRGFAAEDELRGLRTQDDLRGFGAEDDLRGFGAEDELRGFAADDDLRGLGLEDELRGFGAEDELRGLYGYVPEGIQGFEGYVPEEPPQTRMFSQPAQPPDIWKPLW
ncbi:MAG: hypothetical protein U0Z70_22600 [Thermomicrobiales bacterium]